MAQGVEVSTHTPNHGQNGPTRLTIAHTVWTLYVVNVVCHVKWTFTITCMAIMMEVAMVRNAAIRILGAWREPRIVMIPTIVMH